VRRTARSARPAERVSQPVPALFPAPRTLERTAGSHAIGDDPPDVRVEARLAPESYELEISPRGIEIRHADENGLRYAQQTLAQLRRAGRELPGVIVRDGPDFPVRGYMLDVSRDRVPTRATLERLVRLMGRLRINHFELYTEHTFAYRDHEDVWRNASPITPEDVRWLDELCASEGIELVANQNVFGHMARWLEHPRYRHLAEAADGWKTKWDTPMPPGVLAPTDESLAFVQSLLRELVPYFRSRRVNVNCDETFELGKGRSQADVAARGRGRVYVDFLKRILAGLHEDGHDVLFWGDIVRDHPELVPELPRERTTALAWHYEAPMDTDTIPAAVFDLLGDFGITRESLRGFVGQVPPFAKAGFPFWVCPGTSSWNSLLGRAANARGNLLDAAEQGLVHGARGYLITDWGDNGHLQPPSVSFAPLAYGAAVSWCRATNHAVDTSAFLDGEVFADSSGRLAAALEKAGSVYARTGLRPFNGSPLLYQLIGGGLSFLARLMGSPDERGIAGVVETLGETAEEIRAATPACEDAAIVRRELLQAIRLARHGAWRTARQVGFASPSDADLRRDLAEAIEEQRACWLERSRPGGLAESVGRLEKTLAEYGS